MAGTRDAVAEVKPVPAGALAGPAAPADLGWTLTTLLRGYIRAADVVLADLPGGGRAFRLLASVASAQMPTQLALAESAGLDRTVVTYLLDDLVAAGLVQRRPDPTDRRARRIVLTDHGVARLADFRRLLDEAERHVLAPLGEDDSALLRTLLARAADSVRHADHATCAHMAALARSDCAAAADADADAVSGAAGPCGSADQPC